MRTRAALLDAARALFSSAPYGQAGIREIGRHAQVDGALVARYFGSKRALFEAALDGVFDVTPYLEGPERELAARLASAVTAPKELPFDPLRLMLNAASDPEARPIVRERLSADFVAPLAAALGGAAAEPRATLLLACLVGYDFARGFLELDAASAAETEAIFERLIRMCTSAPHAKGGAKRRRLR